ncbi:MAG TPA: hypothetical protein VLB07_04345 [Woeseiaceae bacterium]|nr:hypothetical protein [Woeseiaceae bacterium]
MSRPIDIFVGIGRLPLVRLQRAAVRYRLHSVDVAHRESRAIPVAQEPAGAGNEARPVDPGRH